MTLSEAVEVYQDRQSRATNPDGKFDKAGRWYPSDAECQGCCGAIRSPSRAYPYSYMTHCRSAEHVAHLAGVNASELRKAARRQSPARREVVSALTLVA